MNSRMGKYNFELTASMMCANYGNLAQEVKALEEGGIDSFHIDIMDGRYVPNFAMSLNDMRYIAGAATKPLDVHLMIEEPFNQIDRYIKSGSDYLCFHIEATKNPQMIIDKIKEASLKVGIAIKPKTPLDVILPYLPFLDLVLVMSVEPGFGGQKFMAEVLYKTEELAKIRKKYAYQYLIEMDGGINNENFQLIKKAGCDIIVVGSYLFQQDNLYTTIKELEE